MELTPAYEIVAGGEDWTAAIRRALVELRVESTAERTADSVEIVLGDEVGAVAAPPAGRTLAVRIGYAESGLSDAGEYWHSETEIEFAPRRVTIRGVAADFRASATIKAPRTRAWHDTTVDAVVRAVAAEHGLEPHVAAEYADAAVPHLDQTESDLHLLRRLAAAHDATAKVVGQRLVFSPAAAPSTATGKPMPEVAFTPDTPHSSARVSYRERPRYSAVRAPWIDYRNAATAHETAGDGKPLLDLADPFPSQAQAAAAAQAALRQHARAAAELELDVPGNPALFAGATLIVKDWDPLANGRWSITRATHTIAPTGYNTAVTVATIPASSG